MCKGRSKMVSFGDDDLLLINDGPASFCRLYLILLINSICSSFVASGWVELKALTLSVISL